MTLIKIFEKVNLFTPIEQRRFFNFFDASVEELQSMYSGFVFEKESEYKPPENLKEEVPVLSLYQDAIVDNIIFLETSDEFRKSEFIRKSRAAYLKYYCDNAKGRKIQGRKW